MNEIFFIRICPAVWRGSLRKKAIMRLAMEMNRQEGVVLFLL